MDRDVHGNNAQNEVDTAGQQPVANAGIPISLHQEHLAELPVAKLDERLEEDDKEDPSAAHYVEGESSKRKRRASSDGDSDGGGKKSRLIWGPKLHARFLQAVKSLSLDNAVPMRILQIMNVEGVTREQVASHLQKYRLHLKRLAGLPPGAPLSAENKDLLQRTQDAWTCGTAFSNIPDVSAQAKTAAAAVPSSTALAQQSLQMQLPLGLYPFSAHNLQGFSGLAALNSMAKAQAPLLLAGSMFPGLQNNPMLSVNMNMMQMPFAYTPVQFCMVPQNTMQLGDQALLQTNVSTAQ